MILNNQIQTNLQLNRSNLTWDRKEQNDGPVKQNGFKNILLNSSTTIPIENIFKFGANKTAIKLINISGLEVKNLRNCCCHSSSGYNYDNSFILNQKHINCERCQTDCPNSKQDKCTVLFNNFKAHGKTNIVGLEVKSVRNIYNCDSSSGFNCDKSFTLCHKHINRKQCQTENHDDKSIYKLIVPSQDCDRSRDQNLININNSIESKAIISNIKSNNQNSHNKIKFKKNNIAGSSESAQMNG